MENDDSIRRSELGQYRIEILEKNAFETERAEYLLKEQLGVRSLTGFGCQDMKQGIVAAGAIVYYLEETQRSNPRHIKEIVTYHIGDFMFLDEPTIWNLELFRTMRRQTVKGTLFQILDKTATPIGSRLLKRWIAYPLVDLKKIRLRLAAVSSFKDDPLFRDDVRKQLEGIYDLERLNGRISLGRANARDMVALKDSIRRLPDIKMKLRDSVSEYLAEISEKIDILQDISELIEMSIHDEPPGLGVLVS